MAVKVSRNLGTWTFGVFILLVLIGSVVWELGKAVAVWKYIFG